MLLCQGIQGISDLTLAYLVLCVPHLFMHYSFYLDHASQQSENLKPPNSFFQI